MVAALVKAMIESACTALPDLAEEEAFLLEGVLGRDCGTNSGASALKEAEAAAVRGSEPERTRRPSTLLLLEVTGLCGFGASVVVDAGV